MPYCTVALPGLTATDCKRNAESFAFFSHTITVETFALIANNRWV